VKFIGTKHEFGKVIIESEVTLQNPDMMVALFMLMIMKVYLVIRITSLAPLRPAAAAN
jgi:hypothetical protein